MGPAARQPAAARLVPVGRLVHHDRTAAVRAPRRPARAAHRHRARRRRDDLHAGRDRRRAAGQGQRRAGAPRPGLAADAAHGRAAVRAPAWRRRLHPGAVARAHRHVRAAHAHLAGPRSGRAVQAALAGPDRRRAADDLGAGRRPAGAYSGHHAAGGGVRRPGHPRGGGRRAASGPTARLAGQQPAAAVVRGNPRRRRHPRRGSGLACQLADQGRRRVPAASGRLPAGTGAYLAQARVRDGEGAARAVRRPAARDRRADPRSRRGHRLRRGPPGRGGAGRLGHVAGGAALPELARHDQPDPARRDRRQRGALRAEHAGRCDRPERAGVRDRAAIRRRAGRPHACRRPARPRHRRDRRA